MWINNDHDIHDTLEILKTHTKPEKFYMHVKKTAKVILVI